MTKKKLITKVVAFATAAMMLVGMAIPAMAAPTYPNTGTITVHKYAGLVGSSIANNTGVELNTSDAKHPVNNNYTALEDAGFTLYKVDDLSPVMAAIKDGEVITKTEVIETSGYAPSVKYTLDGGTVSTRATTEHIAEQLTDNTGKTVFGAGDLPDGVYVLVETDTPTGYNTAAPSIIRLPLTDAAGKANYDVHVYPKNVSDVDVVRKDIANLDAPVKKDDIIAFDLKTKFLSDTVNNVDDLRSADGTVYGTAKILETFNSYFEYQASPGVKVYWLGANGKLSTIELATGERTIDTSKLTSDGQITVSLTEAGIDEAIAEGYIGFGFTVSAKYTGGASAAAGATPSRVENTMNAKILKAGETDPTPEDPGPGDTTYVPSISIKVAKTDTADAALAGVTFALATSATPTINLVPGQAFSAYTSADQAKIRASYVLDDDDEILMATTDGTGFVLFSNLVGYTNASGAKFYLKEVATATNYQLKSAVIEVNFKTKALYEADATKAAWFDASGKWTEAANITETANITNYRLDEKDPDEPGFSLPLTGGAGTIAFTVAGIVLMLGAALLIVRKRKEA